MPVQEDRIHDALYARIAAFDFPRVSYDKDTGLRTTDEADTEDAQTILIRPTSSAFEAAVGYRRTPRARERVAWVWTVDLAFDNQVSLESFEELEPILLTRTNDFDQQVVITLDSADYTHPPQHSSSSGTRAVMLFTAALSRK